MFEKKIMNNIRTIYQSNIRIMSDTNLNDGNYTCNCGKSYKLFKNYKAHYIKNKCQIKLIEIPGNPTPLPEQDGEKINEPEIISQTADSTQKQQIPQIIDAKYSNCDRCGLQLLKKNMRRHRENNCKVAKNISAVKKGLDVASNFLSEYNNILINNGIIGSNNTINDNRQVINVNVSCITQENKEHLTEENKIEIVKRIFTAFDCLLDHIYKDDRNKNIYYLGNSKKEVKYISESGEVNVGDADNIIGNIAMSHLNFLDELIDSHRDAVPKPYQKTIDELINYHSTEDCNPRYIKKTGQKIMSFRDYAKAQIKRYEQEYIAKQTPQLENI